MTEDEVTRRLPTFPATYMLRDGAPVCTICGAVIARAGADQIRHRTWHANLAGLLRLPPGKNRSYPVVTLCSG